MIQLLSEHQLRPFETFLLSYYDTFYPDGGRGGYLLANAAKPSFLDLSGVVGREEWDIVGYHEESNFRYPIVVVRHSKTESYTTAYAVCDLVQRWLRRMERTGGLHLCECDTVAGVCWPKFEYGPL